MSPVGKAKKPLAAKMTDPAPTQQATGSGIAQVIGSGTANVAIGWTPESMRAAGYTVIDPKEKQFDWPRPWDFTAYVANKRRGFVGRDWLFKEVCGWYDDSDGAQALLICADFGVGKSAFMAELTFVPHGIQIAAHHFCHHDTIETLSPATFVRSVAAQLAGTFTEYKSAVEASPDARRWLEEAQLDPASAFERVVIGPLNAVNPPAAPQVLIVDALDEALDFEAAAGGSRPTTIVRLLAARARRLPSWLRILATSRRRQEVLQPIQSAFRHSMLDGEDARNLDDIRGYVAGRCSGAKLASVLEKAGSCASDTAALLSGAKQSGGKFLYAVRVLDDIESGALSLGHLQDLPPGIDGFYLDAFERRFPESDDYAPVGALLGVLCVQREPMSRVELAAILCTTEAQVGKMLMRLEDFLRVRVKRYALDHLSIAQWLSEEDEHGFPRAGRFSVELNTAAMMVAGWAGRELASHRVHESEYLARHLGAYLSLPERIVQLAVLLPDFRWLNARLRAAGINALLMDFAETTETPALKALERALRHSAHVLGHDGDDWLGADMLASQILGRLQSLAEPEIHALCAQTAEQFACNAGWRPLIDSLRSAEALLRTLEGHTNAVVALAVLHDGRLASGSQDHTIKLWNPASSACEATLQGHTDSVEALAVLADGRLASGSRDHTIKLWNPTRGVCETTLEGHTGWVAALALLADGRLASGSNDNTIKLWNLTSGVCEATLKGHSDWVDSLAVLAGARLASGSHDRTIRLWNLASGVSESTLEGHTCSVSALAVLADGRLASGAYDDAIRLWDMASGMCEATLEGHDGWVTALAVLNDGQLVSGSHDETIKLWNPASGMCEATLRGHTNSVDALAVLADGRFASGGYDAIKLWNVVSGMREATLEAHSTRVEALAVLADGRLASGSRDHTIKLWNPASGACEATLVEDTYFVNALAELPDGRLASGESDDRIRLWNLASGMCEATLEGHTSSVGTLAVLADGRLASGSEDSTIRLWNPETGVCEATLELDGHDNFVRVLAVLGNGWLASGSLDNIIRLWNPASGMCEATLEGHTSSVCALAALPYGRLASGSADGTVKLWNVARGVCEATLEGHADLVFTLSVLSDGRLASGSWDHTIRVWDERNGHWTGAVCFVADAGISALVFAARAGVLVAGDVSGRVHFLKETG